MDQANGAAAKSLTAKSLTAKSLDDWRRQIDTLDTELLRLVNQRAAIACEIAGIKVASGLPAYDASREAQVLERIAAQNIGPFERESVVAIFRGIIHETRRLGTRRMLEQGGQAAVTVQEPATGSQGGH
jgi:chorismate mutase